MSVTTTEDEKNDNVSADTKTTDVMLRVNELEKTIKFLKEDQKRMLSYLHQEIASLQNKNRGNILLKFNISQNIIFPETFYLIRF